VTPVKVAESVTDPPWLIWLEERLVVIVGLVLLTVREKVLEPPEWPESPLYVAVIM
jgi:hypothetical protein